MLDSIKHTSDAAIEKSEDFLKNSEEYYKLKLFQIATSSLGMLLKFAVLAFFLFTTYIFLAIALALSLGKLFQNLVMGYVVVAGISLIFGYIVYLLRDKIDNAIIKIVSRNFFDDEDNL